MTNSKSQAPNLKQYSMIEAPNELLDILESLRVCSPRFATCAVIPADAGIQKPDWMPDQVRHDAEYAAACGGAVYYWNLRDCLEFEYWNLRFNDGGGKQIG